MPDGLYERDVLAWAGQQSDLLRRLAAGERVNESVDWLHVIEEVQDVGLSELRACQSLLVQAMMHLAKLQLWPDSQSAAHWRGEVATFLAGARRNFTPSMRQRLAMDELYSDALYGVKAEAGIGEVCAQLPDACPFTLHDLLGGRPEIANLIAKFVIPGG